MVGNGRAHTLRELPHARQPRPKLTMVKTQDRSFRVDQRGVSIEGRNHRAKSLVGVLVLQDDANVVEQAGQERVFEVRTSSAVRQRVVSTGPTATRCLQSELRR